MNYDYSTIIAIYKDGTELFRLYEGSTMLWEKPFKRIWVYLNDSAALRSVISNVITANGYNVKVQDLIDFNNSIKALTETGYLIELYVEDGVDGSAKPSILTDLQNVYVNTDDGVSSYIEPVNGTALNIRSSQTSTISSSISVIIDNNVYGNVDVNILFGNQIKPVLMGSIWYVSAADSNITVGNSIKSIVATIDFVTLNILDGLSSHTKPSILGEIDCDILSFDSLYAYAKFLEAQGIPTSISTSDGLYGDAMVTMFRLTELADFDNLYLYNIDGETLDKLRLIEE